jgi:hypothetical protein
MVSSAIGEVVTTPSMDVLPSSYLVLDGSAHYVADYPILADILRDSGGPAPSGMFRLPNLLGRYVGIPVTRAR